MISFVRQCNTRKRNETHRERERLITRNVKQYIKRDVRKYFNQTEKPIRHNKDQLLFIINGGDSISCQGKKSNLCARLTQIKTVHR